ncbi:GNAT family N-acetyltransferase [Clostridium sp. 1001271st1 H5]|uniref:GNAT family N-acetyltransferase n=1 Tax=unclassified Clostridium TaxID=2614128 RepID=UPI00325A931A
MMKNSGTVRLETERLVLRPFAAEDADAMYRNWASDSQVTKFLFWEPHKDVDETRGILEGWIQSYGSGDFYNWAIAWKEDESNVIGSLGVPQLNQKAGRVTVGYCLSRKWWRHGIMKEAFAEVIRFFFEEEGANRVEALHDTRNVNSGKVMAACGLKKEGTLRQYGWNNQGICDECIYGMVASDYFEGK